jgi:heme/copper-type cytochrome/quinol oxidase subunit 2
MLIRVVVLFAEKESLPYSRLTYRNDLEWVWTMTPALILCAIGAPSFALLYVIEELNQPEVTLKGIGHQWHWCYEYSDFLGTPDFCLLQTRNSWETHLVLPLESLVVQEAELEFGTIRLLPQQEPESPVKRAS